MFPDAEMVVVSSEKLTNFTFYDGVAFAIIATGCDLHGTTFRFVFGTFSVNWSIVAAPVKSWMLLESWLNNEYVYISRLDET